MAELNQSSKESEPLHELETDLREIENSIKHLKRSNKELAEMLAQSNDDDFREAINENIVVILRQEKMAIELRAAMGKAQPICDAVNTPPQPPQPEQNVQVSPALTENEQQNETSCPSANLSGVSGEGEGLFL